VLAEILQRKRKPVIDAHDRRLAICEHGCQPTRDCPSCPVSRRIVSERALLDRRTVDLPDVNAKPLQSRRRRFGPGVVVPTYRSKAGTCPPAVTVIPRCRPRPSTSPSSDWRCLPAPPRC
jgi:hypothetical protein